MKRLVRPDLATDSTMAVTRAATTTKCKPRKTRRSTKRSFDSAQGKPSHQMYTSKATLGDVPSSATTGVAPLGDKSVAYDSVIRETLCDLLSALADPTSTICPSEIPRRLHQRDPKAYPDWRSMMIDVRNVIWDEVHGGRMEVTQKGIVRTLKDREGLRGPIRVRRGSKWDTSAAST